MALDGSLDPFAYGEDYSACSGSTTARVTGRSTRSSPGAPAICPADFARFARSSAAMAPRLGPALAYGHYDGTNAAAFGSWPLRNPPSDWRCDLRAPGADPVLLVGSVGDPSTPYPGAVALAATLDNARCSPSPPDLAPRTPRSSTTHASAPRSAAT